MKKSLSLIIGFAIMLGGLHITPAHAMEMKVSKHCTVCSEEKENDKNCPPAGNENSETKAKRPLSAGCDCHFSADKSSHHSAILQSCTQPDKSKTAYTTNIKPADSFSGEKTFSSEILIHAPPGYLSGLTTVRQLK